MGGKFSKLKTFVESKHRRFTGGNLTSNNEGTFKKNLINIIYTYNIITECNIFLTIVPCFILDKVAIGMNYFQHLPYHILK